MDIFSPRPFVERNEQPSGLLTSQLHRATYRCLRTVMVVVAVALPFGLLIAAGFIGPKPSMSAFYHSEMRNVFVGCVFALGVCLYIYKGYNSLENHCLTVAGFSLFGVALAPTSAPSAANNSEYSANWNLPWLHNTSAILFFSMIAVVCIFARNHGLYTSSEDHGVLGPVRYNRRYAAWYNATATVMVLVLVVGLTLWLRNRFNDGALFWLEACAIWTFAAYWILKSHELRGLE